MRDYFENNDGEEMAGEAENDWCREALEEMMELGDYGLEEWEREFVEEMSGKGDYTVDETEAIEDLYWKATGG